MCMKINVDAKVCMNIFHSFWDSLYKRRLWETKLFGFIFFISVFMFHTVHFIRINIFNNCRRKFPKIPLDKETQTVVVTSG